MYKILTKRVLAPNIYWMDVEASRLSKSAKPGQFLIVKVSDKGERIPLTICDFDREKNSVSIVFQAVGKSTNKMAAMEVGDAFCDFVGPLGNPSEFVYENIQELRKKKILFVAGGVGIAPVYPQVKWMNEQGVEVDVVAGARSNELVILKEEMEAVAANLYIATDDGSLGTKGLVTDVVRDLVEKQHKNYDHVVAIGPMIMMKFVAALTKELDIPTVVSLNTLMVDGTGMCGACRVSIGGNTKFTCVDGPEFDGHLVDYDEAMRRQSMYKSAEGRKQMEDEHKQHKCKIGGHSHE